MTPSGASDSVYRVVSVIASHSSSWEAAAAAGIAEVSKTITDLRVARVVELDTVVQNGDPVEYRVKLRVSFRVDPHRVIHGRTTTVRRYLVLANQTLSSPALIEALSQRSAAEPAEFHLLVPVRLPVTATMLADPWAGYALYDEETMGAVEEHARQDAGERLATALTHLRASGALATAELTFRNPLTAIASVLQRGAFDEIIVCTLPARLSHWLHVDLPPRVRRRFALPVTHIEQPD